MVTEDQSDNRVGQMLARLHSFGERPAVFWRGQELRYGDLLDLVDEWGERLGRQGVVRGTVCGMHGDFSPLTCALFLALMRIGAIIVPFTPAARQEMGELSAIAGVERTIAVENDQVTIASSAAAENALIVKFRSEGRPGLVIFTSGSTGRPKGILHDCERVLAKFLPQRRGWRTLLFLMMDHFGGFNTFLSAFAYGGTAVCIEDRTPDAVCRTIEQAKVTLLPTTPTFLRLLLLSEAPTRYDLSSVQLITYGAEPMPQATLDRVRAAFPNAHFKQTYGLSELGVLHSQSPEEGSTWLRLGGEGFETRVVDDVLWIRSKSSMVGYLNAPSPFDAEGWMNTGDRVERRDGMFRFLGRETEIINVGGQKVFPSEVENVLLQASNVRDATVLALQHPLLGQVPCARVTLVTPEPLEGLIARLRGHCSERLAKYKIPMRFIVDEGSTMNRRLKKNRDLS